MQYLLTILLSFYPSLFIYSSIPTTWMKWIDGIIPAGSGFFFVHFAVFAVIFAIIYIVLSKYISIGFFSNERRGLVGGILMIIFVVAIGLITFYNVLPGNIMYESPGFLDTYLLKNPYTFLMLAIPWGYLFFD